MPRIDTRWTHEEQAQALRDRPDPLTTPADIFGVTWAAYVMDRAYYRQAFGSMLSPWIDLDEAIRERGDTPTPIGRNSGRPEGPRLQCAYCAAIEGCGNCRPDLFATCECGRAYLRDSPDGCSCWVTCEECGSRGYHPGRVTVITLGGNRGYMCSNTCLADSGYRECTACCNYYPPDEYDDGSTCENCRPCSCGSCYECRSRSVIRNYSYRPTPDFRGEGPLYLGMENEIETPPGNGWGEPEVSTEDLARWVAQRVGSVGYLKHDGSLEDGFELVTHPMSLQWAMDRFPWDMYPEMQDEFGVKYEDTTGLHVHASRDGFSNARHLYMWLRFFYRNGKSLQQVARRPDGEWSTFESEVRASALTYSRHLPGETISNNAWYLKGEVRGTAEWRRQRWGYESLEVPGINRYSAVNVNNRHTVEVRIFAGSVDAQEIRAALQLVHGSIEYARTLDAASVLKKSGWEWNSFTAWLDGQSRYDDLSAEIERLVY